MSANHISYRTQLDMNYASQVNAILSAVPNQDRMDQDELVKAVARLWVTAFPWVGGELSREDARSGCTFDNVSEHQTRRAAIADILVNSPRGSWASLIQRIPTGEFFTDILIADGRGGYLLASKHKTMSVAEARDRLVHKEVCSARQIYRRGQRKRQARELMQVNAWEQGTELRSVVVTGKPYKVVAITEVLGDGSLVLTGLRRGASDPDLIRCMPHEIEVSKAHG